jgi:hypothetical protein
MKFETVEAAVEFMQSGNARVRIRSLLTKNEYTYVIKENRTGKQFYVYLVAKGGGIGFMGSIVNGDFQRKENSQVHISAPAYLAFAWTWAQLTAYHLPEDIEIERVA